MAAESGDGGEPPTAPANRRQAIFKAWTTALSLSAVGAAATAVVAGGAGSAEAGIVEDIGTFLLPPQDQSKEISIGDFDREISYENFQRALLKGDVTKCNFFGANFDKAVIVLKDGTKALIGEGYPQERAFSDDSPMKVVGLLRNAGVPFTTDFGGTTSRMYPKQKVYKSAATLEAEKRQKSEDETLEALMAQ